ncbi:MAG: hypothetical protein K8S27_05330 [Candidatus Omnitrophica bacterium]|nr:hypothetical protein [Candidatus Omnitrophota bacterium]
MNTITHIFKKDFAKLKVLLSIWFVLLILHCVNGFSVFLDNYRMQLYLPDINALIAGLQYLMVIVIVPLLIQDDPLVGNSAFWLTRPISRKELLIEKMAFLTFFLLILPLCAELFVLISNGVAPRYLFSLIPEFFYRQLQFIVPVLLIASLTQKFSKFALVGIISLVVWYLVSLITNLFPLFYNIEITDFLKNILLAKTDPHNISLEWSINLIKIMASALLCAFVIYNQFINRDSKRTIRWIIYSFIIVALINKFWSVDFLNIEKFQPRYIASLDSTHVVPDRNSVWTSDGYDFSNKQPEEKYKDVYLTHNVEGVPSGHFVMLDKLKNPRLKYADGTTLVWDEDIEGRNYAQVNKLKFFNPISSILKNTKIVNKYKKSKSVGILMKVTDVNFDKYGASEADYSAEARFNVYKYNITSVLPLKAGAMEWIGNEQYVVYDVIKTTFGVKIVIGEKKVDLILAEGEEKSKFPFNDFGFARGMEHKQPFYILRNKKTGEAFVPEITQDAQISKPKFNDSAILKSRISQFVFAHKNDRNFSLPNIDEEWLKDAEILRLEAQKVGYVNKKLAYDKILLDEKKDYVDKDGTRIFYFNTGEVKKEQPDISVKQASVVKTYYKTGDLKAAWIYKDGELTGVSRTYYQDGTLMAEWHYENGSLNGISNSYFQSGELFYEYSYEDGELHGLSKKYNKSGDVVAGKNFVKGELLEKKD